MVLICSIMFLICRLGMVDGRKSGNIRQSGKSTIHTVWHFVYRCVYLLFLLILSPDSGDLPAETSRGRGRSETAYPAHGTQALLLLGSYVIYTRMVYCHCDRVWEENVRNWNCTLSTQVRFIANEQVRKKDWIRDAHFWRGVKAVSPPTRPIVGLALMLPKETALAQLETGSCSVAFICDGHWSWNGNPRQTCGTGEIPKNRYGGYCSCWFSVSFILDSIIEMKIS